ncbi:LysR family transcriptional regulator [Gluconobacter thailandicus NBRC 3257]|uniref:LysR family transcriptional regulator n=1 Tax=Gluconobacter thailandicus NBRC 3257 TaxID=1381097 RepID=A0ABQ0J0X8_GLUTH|nr:LysR family transcriptional regulator [Gluconobacter thailandicus NBRC 3255]GAD28080.1 LysR family transcriptional regulator [Gluconobacter thailandicus NBRC 3257]
MRWGRTKIRRNVPSEHLNVIRNISLISLRHAVIVAEVLNFRQAATVLGTTQSSVSARIKGLEDALGVMLFERRHRGVRLTNAGRCFVAEVSTGIAKIDHAVRRVGALMDGAEGHLSIGLYSPISTGFLADLRRKFRTNYPMIRQSVLEGNESEIIALVREGTLDMAFILGAVNSPDCHSRELWSEPVMVVLPTDHPLAEQEIITWIELADETFLVRHGGAGPKIFEHVVRRISERKRSSRIHRCNVARDTLMAMVAAGEGITLVSKAATYIPFPGVVFRTIVDEPEEAHFNVIWSPHNRNPALLHMLNLATK